MGGDARILAPRFAPAADFSASPTGLSQAPRSLRGHPGQFPDLVGRTSGIRLRGGHLHVEELLYVRGAGRSTVTLIAANSVGRIRSRTP
jgi:hypothetical protein